MTATITSTFKVAVRENGQLEPLFEDPNNPPYVSSVISHYKIQHLNTFTVLPTCAPLHTSEAVDLLNRQKTFHVRDYDLKLVKKWDNYELVILDPWHGRQEVERFPLNYLRAPRYRMTSPRKCRFNNLFLFTVEAYSMPDGGPDAHELHIFQVLSCPASELVGELIRAGIHLGFSDSCVATHSINCRPIAAEPQNRVDAMPAPAAVVLDSRTSNYSTGSENNSQPVAKTAASGVVRDENLVAVELNSDWLNNEGTLMNHCFDDVEENMQHIREKILEIRKQSTVHTSLITASSKRTNRKISKWGQQVEEYTLDDEFRAVSEDFFRKLKFSVILLSRLSDHVKDPNAPVLVRQLFALLSESVEYWRKFTIGSADYPRTIDQPLFPRYTVVFLEANLDSEHEKLLRELGPAWNKAREDLKPLPVYIPTFKNGFKVIPENYDPTLFNYDKPGVDLNPEHRYLQVAKLNAYAKQLLRNNLCVQKAICDYAKDSTGHVAVQNGEYVELLDDSGDLHQIRKESGETGLCPATVLTPVELM